MKSFFFVAKVALLLFALASIAWSVAFPPEKYVPPERPTYAYLRSELTGANYNPPRSHVVHIKTPDSGRRKILFTVTRNESVPAGYIAVESQKPVEIIFYGSASGAKNKHGCKASVKARLQADKKYTLRGGEFSERDSVGSLAVVRCRLRIQEG